VSLEVNRLLAEQFDLSGSFASTSFQPFLLDYFRVHLIVLEFFVRMFQDSGATAADFNRVSTLTMSQVKVSLGKTVVETSSGGREPKSYFALKQEFEEAKYEDVRDRQVKEMEIEDDLLSKLPIR
jgi:engulfment/cell motility protein 1